MHRYEKTKQSIATRLHNQDSSEKDKQFRYLLEAVNTPVSCPSQSSDVHPVCIEISGKS